ncbi:riboflavin synthase [Veillonella sp. CHU110]|uniref:riboflavin synthase n=1 Tax=Veillonella sp. CHU110 TaxID=2490947 RepID=UPI001F0C4916|nr:riboflavin synthase [Veillonella sp. CHU110]
MKRTQNSLTLEISGTQIFDDLKIGDSVAVNGVCLTATTIGSDRFTADVMPESVKMTTLLNLSAGSPVNLERAMAANGRFGGHVVAGHVDGQGSIIGKDHVGNSIVFRITTSSDILHYIIYKGSITVDGASLTVSKVGQGWFEISIIPHTIGNTILQYASIGTTVNLETDIFGRYIEHFMKDSSQESTTPSKVTMDTLLRNGFL